MSDLIERLRGQANCESPPVDDLLREAADALEAARADAGRLDHESIPEGFVFDKLDIYDYACDVAEESGRDEPNDADLLAGHRRMIDAAMAAEGRE